MDQLTEKHCLPCEGGVAPLTPAECKKYLTKLNDWKLSQDNNVLVKDFNFKNYYQTMAFVNAIAWMAHQENHHPDLIVGYNHCEVHYSTHAIGGLSENDFICAAKVEQFIKNA